jgi:hypothetical protein
MCSNRTVTGSWCSKSRFGQLARIALLLALAFAAVTPGANAQKKAPAPKPQTKKPPTKTELEKLHDDYIKATKDLKANLEKQLPYLESTKTRAEQKLVKSKELFSQGYLSKRELDDDEHAVTAATASIEDLKKKITETDMQVAHAFVEVQTDKQIGKMARGSFVRSASLIRYAGAGPWALSQVGKIDAFFRQRFGRPLPIAVFGQGAIHNQWHLDHRNAMDISVNPNGPEAQPLMDFLRANGIPFSAFRSAIPGVATGPHFHIGLPSHRY